MWLSTGKTSGDESCGRIATALLATTALFVGLAQSASAADMRVPYRPPAPPPPPVYFSWTGCYIGGHLGGGWGQKTVSVPALAPGVSVTGDTSGFLGGGQVGCNLQFGSNWVIGIEGDGSGSDIRGDITQTVLGITGTAHAQTDWIASATGRAVAPAYSRQPHALPSRRLGRGPRYVQNDGAG